MREQSKTINTSSRVDRPETIVPIFPTEATVIFNLLLIRCYDYDDDNDDNDDRTM